MIALRGGADASGMEFALKHKPGLIRRLHEWLPEGRALPDEVWKKRHRGVRILLVVEALGLIGFGLVRGRSLLHVTLEASIVAFAAFLAGTEKLGRKFQAVVATYGLLVFCALLVHFAGGSIEAHFSFFVMLSIIALYQDWTTFLLALGFVVVHHGLMGALSPGGVYNHSAAVAHPWKWAAVHGGFVLASAVANLVLWRANESARRQSEEALEDTRAAESELKRTLSLLTATLESTADGILVVDNDDRITSINHQFVRMWRLPDEIVASGDDQRAIRFVVDQVKDPDGFVRKIRELYADPGAESFDILEFKDGRRFERFSKPQQVGGETVGRVWSFRDVTEQKKLDELKDGLLTAVSHELRTPLTNVVGLAHTLNRSADQLDAGDRRTVYARLSVNALKLERLVTDMLDLDRLTRGLVAPHRQRSDIGAIVTRVAREPDLVLEHDINLDAAKVMVSVDPAKVERIVENLVINASRHTPAGTPVWVKVRAHEGGALISVDDAGPGVPDELKVSIFEPFHQGPSQRPHSPGVGIGLSLVARFAALHGGTAWVEDRVGGGASFNVFLPGDSTGRPKAEPRRSKRVHASA